MFCFRDPPFLRNAVVLVSDFMQVICQIPGVVEAMVFPASSERDGLAFCWESLCEFSAEAVFVPSVREKVFVS